MILYSLAQSWLPNCWIFRLDYSFSLMRFRPDQRHRPPRHPLIYLMRFYCLANAGHGVETIEWNQTTQNNSNGPREANSPAGGQTRRVQWQWRQVDGGDKCRSRVTAPVGALQVGSMLSLAGVPRIYSPSWLLTLASALAFRLLPGVCMSGCWASNQRST